MKQHGNFLERLMDYSDLPGEPLPKIPLVELCDDRRVLIENHNGITEYGRERIKVRMRYGEICICGRELVMSRMTGNQLIIRGRIDGLSVCRRK